MSMNRTKPRHKWTDEQVAILSSLYPSTRSEYIAKQLGLGVKQIYYKALKLGLKKSAEYLNGAGSGRFHEGHELRSGTQFKPGHKTWNKGMKGLNIGGVETQFKPGNRSGIALEMYQPIGTERLSKDGYIQRKVNDDMPIHRRWRGLHIIKWEAINGPLPEGHALTFRDGDKLNTAIENLELLPRSELMKRNSRHLNYPKEINKLIQLRGAITRQINKGKNHEQ